MIHFQDFPHRHQQRDLRQDPLRAQPGRGHDPAGPLHRHRRVRPLPLPVHRHADHLRPLRAQESLQVLVGALPVLDDGVRHGVNVRVYFVKRAT